MKLWQNIKQWLCGGCVYFSVLALLLIFSNLLIRGTENAGQISTLAFLRVFPCGLCMSAAGMLWHFEKMPRWARILLHYIIDVLAVFLFLYLPGSTTQAATRLVMFVLLSVIYWALFGIIALVKSRVRKLMEED